MTISLIKKSPYSLMFFLGTLMGIFITLSSSSWFMAWLGLELNMFMFLPLMFLSNTSTNTSLKYFIIQACASLALIQMMLLTTLNMSNLFIAAPLTLKLALAPLHFWLPSVAENLNMKILLMLLTLQKLSPLFLMSLMNMPNKAIATLSTLSALAGSTGGLNQTSTRKILAFSSINHMGWIMASLIISSMFWLNYYMFYSILTFLVIFSISKTNLKHLNEVTILSLPFYPLIIAFLSLGGLPPLLGFVPKLLVLNELSFKAPLLSLTLIFSSVITLYFYLKLSLNLVLLNPKKTKTSNSFSTFISMLLNFSPSLFLLTSTQISMTFLL